MLMGFGQSGFCQDHPSGGNTSLNSCTYSHCIQYCKPGGVVPVQYACDFDSIACTKLFEVRKEVCKKSGTDE
jgi:hypothetical protein